MHIHRSILSTSCGILWRNSNKNPHCFTTNTHLQQFQNTFRTDLLKFCIRHSFLLFHLMCRIFEHHSETSSTKIFPMKSTWMLKMCKNSPLSDKTAWRFTQQRWKNNNYKPKWKYLFSCCCLHWFIQLTF